MELCLHPEERGCFSVHYFLLSDSQKAQHDTSQVDASRMIYDKSKAPTSMRLFKCVK